MTIKVVDENLKFRNVPIKNLREDYIYDLILSGRISRSQFTQWVENERDAWFLKGMQSQQTS